jgi:prophage regulatory protein
MNYDLSQEEKMQSNLLPSAPAPVQQHQVIDYLIPRKTVEKLSGLSRATIYRLIKSGKFPRPLSIGTGAVRWRQSEVIAWQQSLSPST